MSIQGRFHEISKSHMETLKQYVPIVAKVHGSHHPEFYDVQKVFEAVLKKIVAAGADMPQLDDEFAALRSITDEYTVPAYTCETYEAVYNMLSEMDTTYHAES